NLETALKQLMTYALALDNPPLLVVSDRLRIEIHTHFTGTPSELHTIALADIGTPENLQKLRWLFTDPEKFKPQRTRAAITLQAAKLIGDLAWQLQQRGHDPHQVAHFLNKIIFCLFAEDAKGPASEPLLPNQIFSTVLKNGRTDISRFERQLKNLFKAMSDRHGEFGEHVIQWFNGGLFDDDLTLPLTSDDIDKLINVSLLDWSAIEPSIFGTLFERGLDPAKRSQLGAHYTDPVSIMRIVNPVIVEPLLSEWQIEKESIAASMAVFHEFENSKKSAEKAKATKALKDATARYITFKEKLKAFKVLDPACGSGNFLYLALQALKDIELRVGLEAEELGLERGFPEVGPQSMYGIEISPYAAELAKV
ncbi:MAG: DNA methyltransferase, partial [Betaproteobacteria bacterium]